MKWAQTLAAVACLGSLAGVAAGDTAVLGQPIVAGPGCCPPPPFYPGFPTTPGTTAPGTTTPGTTTPGTNPDTSQSPALSGQSFAQGSEAGTESAASVAPGFFGDQIGPISGRGNIFIPPTVTAPVTTPSGALTPLGRLLQSSGNVAAIEAALPLHASYKIAEDESPQPQNRAYIAYNFYDDVDQPFKVFGLGQANFQRETIGLEKTFQDGQSSLGVRLPFVELTGNQIIQDSEVGDMSLIYKHAFLEDRQTGNLLSGGMVLTLPTGRQLTIAGESSLHSTVFQPFVGFIYRIDSWYFEGFESVAVPTDMRDVALVFSSLGVGYNLYHDESADAPVRLIRPQLELHVNTPLNHRGLTSEPIAFSDSVDMTGGVHILFQKLEFGAGAGTSVTGPKVYDFEALANLTYHF